jgi:hypothetical protein
VQKPSVGIGSGAGSAVTARAGCAVTTIQRCDRRIQLRQRGVQQKLKLGSGQPRRLPQRGSAGRQTRCVQELRRSVRFRRPWLFHAISFHPADKGNGGRMSGPP